MQRLIVPEEICRVKDPVTSLEGVIVVHSTVRGPAAGGCRFWRYADPWQMRLDAMRLAEGMSYKNALADLPLGGGKAVLQRPHGTFSRPELFQAFGRAVAQLEGRYVTAEDVGTSTDDMLAVSETTRYVAGLPPAAHRPGGDPSPWTARGVFICMEAAVRRHLSRELSDCTVAVQGVGHVGASLARMLHARGVRLVVSDISQANVARIVAETNAKAVHVDDIMRVEADVFAPCALGAVLKESTIRTLKARVICGAANNQLATELDGDRLAERGILYAPDYVVNAGGVINVAAEYLGWTADEAERLVEQTGARFERVLEYAKMSGEAPHRAADELARAKIAAAVKES